MAIAIHFLFLATYSSSLWRAASVVVVRLAVYAAVTKSDTSVELRGKSVEENGTVQLAVFVGSLLKCLLME